MNNKQKLRSISLRLTMSAVVIVIVCFIWLSYSEGFAGILPLTIALFIPGLLMIAAAVLFVVSFIQKAPTQKAGQYTAGVRDNYAPSRPDSSDKTLFVLYGVVLASATCAAVFWALDSMGIGYSLTS